MQDTETPNTNSKRNKQPNKKVPSGLQFWIAYGLLMFILLWVWQENFPNMAVRRIPYSEFKQYVANKEVVKCFISEAYVEGEIVRKVPEEPEADTSSDTKSETKPETKSEAKATDAAKAEEKQARRPGFGDPEEEELPRQFNFRTVRVEDPKLVEELQAAGVEFVGVRPGFLSSFFWAWVLPIGIMILIWMFLFRRIGSAGQSVLSFAKSKARLVADIDTGVTFDDVAGCEEAKYELQEVVGFLKDPSRYESIGASIPKGILLVGPPGTGKTLLARAVAGEAKVPFFSMSGSDFVEMFVGVGAARVRDLFQQAKGQAPCIIFIDEMDAIGRQRGVHTGAVNDEREQTLNQLLVEMDGFEANTGVILLAATNRPDVLDRALLRPGRFDRQVVVDAPDIDGREAILKVHARGKKLAEDVNLRKIAQATPGFSGADLANALNEAALLAVRANRKQITQKDIEDAIEKVVAGPERKSRRLAEQEKRRVAFHEVGHALVSAHTPNGETVHKISIVPRGRAALGYTMHLPADDQYLMSKQELIDRIKGLLGGRAAEEVVFGDVTTGAENDLERATALAQQMVCMYGMGESIGLVHCGQRQSMYLPLAEAPLQRDCSPETEREIDLEVKAILTSAYESAKSILTENREQLDRIAKHLLEKETLDAATFKQLLDAEIDESAETDAQEAQPSAS